MCHLRHLRHCANWRKVCKDGIFYIIGVNGAMAQVAQVARSMYKSVNWQDCFQTCMKAVKISFCRTKEMTACIRFSFGFHFSFLPPRRFSLSNLPFFICQTAAFHRLPRRISYAAGSHFPQTGFRQFRIIHSLPDSPGALFLVRYREQES